jgi:hypothetical protein
MMALHIPGDLKLIRGMNRRAFIAAMGGATAWLLVVARAQQTSMPLIGFCIPLRQSPTPTL